MPGKFPRSLCIDIRDRRVLLFVGAGLSLEAGGPSWSDLLLRLVKVAEIERIDLGLGMDEAVALAGGPTTHKLALADLLEERLGKAMEDHIHDLLAPLQPTALHERLVRLPWAGYVTTNYDRLIELAVQRKTNDLPRVIYPEDFPELSGVGSAKDGFVLKLHGGIERKRTIALSGRRIDDITDESAIPGTLAQLFGTSVTLFIGYGLGDEYILEELRKLARLFRRSANRHFAILPQSKLSGPLNSFLMRRYNLQVIGYDDANGHRESLVELLEELESLATGQPARDQVLLILGSPFSGGLGTDGRLLVTQSLPGWTGIWMLPATDAIYRNNDNGGVLDLSATANAIAAMLGAEVAEISIRHIEGPFSSLKLNPRFQELTEYRFRICFVEVLSFEFWKDDKAMISGREYEWITMGEFAEDPATQELNADVVQFVQDVCGSELETVDRIFRSVTPVYHVNPGGYLGLPWVSDNRAVIKCIEDVCSQLGNVETVIDIGCGSGALASSLTEVFPDLNYVGVDKSPAMVEMARKNIAEFDRARLFLMDAESFDYTSFGPSIAVCSNLLEALPRPVMFLAKLRETLNIDALIISDVESVDIAQQVWAEELFDLLKLGHKRHVFGPGSILSLGVLAGWRSVTPEEKSEHEIALDDWLSSLACSHQVSAAAKTFIAMVGRRIPEQMESAQADRNLMRRREVTIGFLSSRGST